MLLVLPTAWLLKVKVDADRVTAGAEAAAPVPDRLVLCGLPLALDVTDKEPVRLPEVVGVNVTLILQLEPALKLEPQLLVWAKSPVAAMPEILRAPVPPFDNVTTCAELVVLTAWLPKVKLLCDRLAAGTPTPVPDSATECQGWLKISELVPSMVNVPLREPVAVGVNVTLMVQLAPTAKDAGQLLVWEKSPLALMVTPVTADKPTALLNVIVLAALVVPTF